MLTHKVALVTGGSRGIGAAIVKRLASDGADVALTYVSSAEKAAAVVDEVKVSGSRGLAIQADNQRPDDNVQAVQQAADHFGRLDILVNNAGIFPFGLVDDVTVDEIDRTFAVHVRAPFLATQAAVRHMTDGGRIISIGSNLAERVPNGGIALYSASKSALTGMTRGFARDFGERGITANIVHPGSTDTDMNSADSDGAEAQRAQTALGRFASPDEVAATVAHLAGPDAQMITGTSILVDGGANA